MGIVMLCVFFLFCGAVAWETYKVSCAVDAQEKEEAPPPPASDREEEVEKPPCECECGEGGCWVCQW